MDVAGLLDGLNESQRAAVLSPAQPLCILAGAGSGKTRVLTRRIARRIAEGEVEPRHVLALTFTRKAAGELNRRLRALGLRDSVAAGTFHSIAYAQLRARWAERGITPPGLLDRKVGFVARLLPAALAKQPGAALDVVGEIEWAKARVVPPDAYVEAAGAAGRRPGASLAAVAESFDRYEREKRRRRLVDFDDLLRLCRRDLLDDRTFAAAQHWRFRSFFVDEFQDVNALQHGLLQAWLGERRDLCVVGDPNQAIYAWNGADAGHLEHFRDDHPGAEIVRLTVNYRSSPQIISVANAVLGKRRREAHLVATRSDGPLPAIVEAADERAEARLIARSVRDHHRPGGRWSEQAVLVRTNAQTTLIEEALHAADVPFRVRGASGLLDQPDVRRVLADIKRSQRFSVVLADLDAGATDTSDDEHAANLAALARLAHDYEAVDPAPTPAGFVSWLVATTNEQPDRDGDAVEIATFHAAKGLEWPIVHLAGVEQGLVPIGHAKMPEALDEELRLFYVAVTRAERELRCTYARQRTFGSRTRSREPSMYLDRVRQAIAPEEAPTPDRRRRRGGEATAALLTGNGGRTAGDAMLAALKAWRSAQAKAADVPAFVIFHDRTLVAVAEAMPRDRRQLLALPGLGEVKVSRYGDELLQLVAEHAGS